MKLPLRVTYTILHNPWQRYRGGGSGKGPKRLIDLQLVAVNAARQALSDELGTPVETIKMEWSK